MNTEQNENIQEFTQQGNEWLDTLRTQQAKRGRSPIFTPSFSTSKKRQYVATSMKDITSMAQDHDTMGQRLRESEARFRLMFEQAKIGMMFMLPPDGRIQQVNQSFCKMLGYSEEEILRHTLFSLTHPDDASLTTKVLESLLAGTPSSTFEKRYLRKDGSILWANVTVSAIHDTQNAHYLSIIEDISERKQAEQEATRRVNELEAMVTTINDGIIFFDEHGHIMRINPAAEQIFELNTIPNSMLLSSHDRSLHFTIGDENGQPLPITMLPSLRILRGEQLTGENIVEFTIRFMNGKEKRISVSGGPMYDANGTITNGVLIARDITEHQQLERRTYIALQGLLNMAEALVQLAENVNDIRVMGQQLAQLTCDVLSCQRVGLFTVEQTTGGFQPIGVVGLSPEQEQQWWHENEQLLESSSDATTSDILTRLRNKEVVEIDFAKQPYDTMPNPYTIQNMLLTPMCIGEHITGLLTLDYGTVRHSYTQHELALTGAIAKLLALVVERQQLLTAQAEAQGREIALQEANRRMEEFLGIASHELRTPLTTIKANVQLAKRRLHALTMDADMTPSLVTKADATHEMLSRAERQVNVLNRLVGDLIDMSRIQTGKLQVHIQQELTDLTLLLSETVEEQCKAHNNRTITLSIDPALAQRETQVHADPDRITQVLTNYLSNALKYSSSEKPVSVSLTLVPQDEHTMLKVAVHDQGQGLCVEEQQRIWDCFYQSESVHVLSGSGVGLGLGLYISQTIIARHGGQVGVESTPGVGSTFWFTLPVATTIIEE